MAIDADELTNYPAHPKHSSFVLPNFLYPDGSMFCFDTEPRYVLDDWHELFIGGLYDLPTMQRMTLPYSYNGWTNWADKFQKDYRFSSQSDTNAQATLFPEVHDPWMYTEYLYQGTQTTSDLTGFDADGNLNTPDTFNTGIVEPQLIMPHMVNRTVDPSGHIVQSGLSNLNDQPDTVVDREFQTIYTLENKWKSQAGDLVEYWQSQLDSMSWAEELPDGSINRNFTRLPIQRRVVKYALPVLNSGVRLNRHPVWVKSTRWGQSQNIPARSLDLTGPKEYFKPNGIFTGKIIPQVTVVWGIPIYDDVPSPETGTQTAIWYQDEGATAGERIFLKTVDVTGPVGQASATFTYPTLPDDYAGAGATEVQNMPRNNTVSLITWNQTNYADNDLVHEGCQFWVGHNGLADCDYFRQQEANLVFPNYDHTDTYTDPSVVLGNITVIPYFDSESFATVYVSCANDTTDVDVTSLDYSLVLNRGASGAITSITVTGTGAINPASSSTGFFSSPGAFVKVHTVVQSLKMPYPDPPLCAMYSGPTPTDQSIDPKVQYKNAGGRCPYYTPTGPRVVHSYQASASNGAEWANLQRGLPAGYSKGPLETSFGQTMMQFAGMGSFEGPIAFNLALDAPTIQPFTKGLPEEDNSTVTITWVPEVVPIGGKSTYYNTSDRLPHGTTPIQDVRIDPTTGFYTFDDEDITPFGGVDSTFYGMVNQINYRVLYPVQHCYVASHCDAIIHNPSGNVGFRRGRYSNVNFLTHPLRMPGYPAYDGTDKYCHTGNMRCPHNNLDRRAAEYNENYKILINEVLRPFREFGIDGFQVFGIEEAFVLPDGTLQFDTDLTENPNAICVGVRLNDNTPPIIGHNAPLVRDPFGTQYRIFFYYDRPQSDPAHKSSHVMAHIVQFDNDNTTQYMKCPDDARSAWTALYTDADTIPWLVELYDNYLEPSGNLLYTTNAKPFSGGRAPEYKDRSKLGQQIVCTSGGSTDTTFETGATQSNQFGGPSWNVAPIEGQINRGYWTMLYGEWILDGRSIGYGEDFVEIPSRMRNHPSVFGNRTPVDGFPSITIQDTTSGMNSGGSDWAATGWSYSNDTKAWTDFMATIWSTYLPTDPNTGDKIPISPPEPNESMLPRERFWYQCDHCGLDFPEEEINFLKTLASNVQGDPLYPLPSGVPQASVPVGPSGAVMGCPRYDGGAVRLVGPYVKFMSCYARGEAEVWAPPGTTVLHDAYFWKAPAFVNRGHKDQLQRKMGAYNTDGGGVTFDNLSPAVEQMGRLPITTSRNYQVGLSRQIVAPLAAPGQKVSAVRSTWSARMNIKATDTAWVQHDGGEPELVADESTFTLLLNDIVTFFRQALDGTFESIGVPISAYLTAPQAILTDPGVMSDDPLPDRSTYPDNDTGERIYQSDLNKWLLSCVTDSIQNFSSNPLAHPNLWSDILTSTVGSGEVAKPIDQTTGDTLDFDERIIAPYTATNQDGLKMVTVREMNLLRNSVLPMLGYSLTQETYSAGGDFTDQAQASYSNRFQQKRKPMPMPTFGTIEPQILAATALGFEAYVQWSLGDVENTQARAYYPTGKAWWRINQTVGCIKRNGGINYLHMDDSGGFSGYEIFALPYTGDDVISSVMMFIHGRIPMDMEILRAILVFTPGDAPSMEAIGCQGQYTGEESVPTVFDNGQFNSNNVTATYVGNLDCFWNHYHGYTTNHELDHPTPYYGVAAKNHVTIGHNNPLYFNQRGTQDDPNMPCLLSENKNPEAYAQLREIDSSLQYEPFLAGGTLNNYTNQIQNLISMSFEDTSHGFDMEPQPWFQAWSFGQDIVQTMTEHQIWKDIDYAEYGILFDRYNVNGQAQVDGIDVVQSFQYVADYFRSYIWPREQAAIPGWMNMAGYDSSGRFSNTISVEPKILDNDWANGPQVLLQDDSQSSGTIASAAANTQIDGGNGTNQAGSVPKIMDITSVIQGIYNDRVDRYYNVTLGASYASLYQSNVVQTDTNEGQMAGFHQGTNDPWYFWNYRFMYRLGSQHYGMWVTDPWHHPPLSQDNPVIPDSDGDPLIQAATDQMARVFEVTDWDKDGITDTTDPAYNLYHPFSLCQADETLSQVLPPYAALFDFQTPRPAVDPAGGYWRVIDSQLFTHYFTMDLRQVPYETNRRPWRNIAPAVNSTNATCPNISCFVHQNGWTMGQLLTNSENSWGGYGVVPSLTSPYCPNCHTMLVGVIFTPGDGLTTVSYGKQFVPDLLINAVEVSSESSTFYNGSHHGFTIEYYNSVTGQWSSLLSVMYDNISNNFEWLEWINGAWTTVSNTTPPTLFLGCEGAGDVPKNTNITGIHFIAVTGMKVRYKVSKPIVGIRSDPTPSATFASCAQIGSTNQIQVASLIDNVANYVGRSITIRRTVTNPITMVTSNQDVTLTITAAVANMSGFALTLSAPFTSDFILYHIDWTEYVTRCTTFRVYGYPYTPGQLIITPPGYVQPLFMTKGVTAFRLNNWPTQIYSVLGTAGDSDPVNMTEVDSTTLASHFYWTVEKDSFNEIDYLRITAGMWYYDFTMNTINISPYYKDPDTGNLIPLWTINTALYNSLTTQFTLKTLPNMLVVQYYTGNGMPVDVAVTSIGAGPSYQLEAESVQFIAQTGDDGLPPGMTSDPLPSMGMSVPLKTNNNQRVALNWQVYNHQPLVWGANSLQWLVGDELGPGAWGRDDLFNVMTGGLGDSIDKIGYPDGEGGTLGQSPIIGGGVAGTCTLYGAPNTILSGNLLVYAKAITIKTYQTPDGPVTMSERTGGYRCGAFTFGLRITDSVTNKRTGVTCSIPQVMIWARKRNLDSDPVPLA